MLWVHQSSKPPANERNMLLWHPFFFVPLKFLEWSWIPAANIAPELKSLTLCPWVRKVSFHLCSLLHFIGKREDILVRKTLELVFGAVFLHHPNYFPNFLGSYGMIYDCVNTIRIPVFTQNSPLLLPSAECCTVVFAQTQLQSIPANCYSIMQHNLASQ